MPTIAVASHKGGSGKTTLVANVAAVLAGEYRVLAVDVDPQGALGAALAVDDGKPTVYEVLAGRAGALEAVRDSAVPGLDVLPADLDLAGADLELPQRGRGWQSALRQALAPAVARYEIVLIDTAPGLGPLSYLALVAADHALICCPPDFLSFRALRGVLGTVEQAQRVNPALRLLGIAPTMVAGRTRHEADAWTLLRDRHAGLLLPPTPRRVAVQDAAVAGEPITVYAPASAAAAAFAALAKEVLSRAH